MKKIYAAFLLSLVVTLAACEGEQVEGVCNSNADCKPNFYCSADHQCLCQSDQACAADEYCNPQGFCQKVQGCRTDADCGANFRCQILAGGKGTCLCTNDQACKENEFCNSSGVCQEKAGCLLDADCGNPDYWLCRINTTTKIGECFCKSNQACEQGEFCNPKGFCQPEAKCQTNDDCPSGKLCNTESGECLCDPDTQSGCKSGEVCNSAGYCQPRPGCYDNTDCENTPGTFCDLTTRTCIPVGSCTSDLQCPLGKICRQNQCVEGCNYSYDCPLTQCCVQYQCQPCNCQNDAFCAFAEYCQGGQCQTAWSNNTPFCKPCSDDSACGATLNRCLIYPFDGDSYAAKSSEYCAVDCSTNDRCPNGFTCSEVIVIKQSDLCTTDLDCPSGVPCWKSPEEDKGYCPCHDTKNACPLDACDTIGMYGPKNTCINRKTPCTTNNDCVIPCVDKDANGFGGCSIGRNCGLAEGIHCPYPWPGHY